jgi:hypothetical protein
MSNFTEEKKLATTLEEARECCRRLLSLGSFYLAEDKDFDCVSYLEPGRVQDLSDDELRRVWFSPNGFDKTIVGRSNSRVLEKLFWSDIYDNPVLGTCFRVYFMSLGIIEVLESLADYPLLDEDVYHEEMAEAQEELWNDWLKSEVVSEIEDFLRKEYGASYVEVDYRCGDEEEFFKLFWEKLNETGGEWVEEQDGLSCRGYTEAARAFALKELMPIGLSVFFEGQ